MTMSRADPRQGNLVVSWRDLPRSPGHAFHDRLLEALVAAGFDAFVESECAP